MPRWISLLAFLTIAAAGTMDGAAAQHYPTRPVRIIVGFPPGGATDVVARLMSRWLTERLDQPFVIENRPGAGTNIAIETATRAPADGYTLVMISSTNTINESLYHNLKFSFIRDIAPVGVVVRVPIVMVVTPSLPANTVSEFIAYAKANPGKISMGSPGNGTPAHVAGELFKMMTGVDMVHVPYRGGAPALTDLLGGQVQVLFVDAPTSVPYIRSGKLRALAVTAATRLEMLPDTPALAEFVPDFEASYWLGLGAPKDTPAEIIDRLYQEIAAALADPKMRERLAALGGTVFALSPADFVKLITEDTERWRRVIQAANIRPD
jgi:tripartite-type tricarboxylate transporter receptor subunit TctC